MNKIVIDNITNNSINYKKEDNKYIFDIDNNTDIDLTTNLNAIEIIFNIKENIILNIKRISDVGNNIKYIYNLDRNSSLFYNSFLTTEGNNEEHHIYLNEEYANVDFKIRTISKNTENYKIYVHHKANNTNSNILLRGVNNEGTIHFYVLGEVLKDIKNCYVNQDNRIYTFNQNKCTIDPILLIENNDVVANHAAFIGKFDEETLFYLMSRGISKNNAIKLLVRGFLNIDNDEEILSIINKYWR